MTGIMRAVGWLFALAFVLAPQASWAWDSGSRSSYHTILTWRESGAHKRAA